jgi:hypothetical protein
MTSTNEIIAMPTARKVKSIAEVKGKGKSKVDKKTKRSPVAIDKLRKAYKILIDDPLPEIDDEKAERKKLIASIKKVLK